MGTGDFNGDAKPDVAAGLDNGDPAQTLRVYLNDGSGALVLTATTGITSVELKAVVDLTGDGKSDLIGAGASGNALNVQINNGSNAFIAQDYSVTLHPMSVKVGDFYGDLKKDLAVSYDPVGSVNFPGTAIMLGDGMGGLTRRDISKPGLGSFSADFNIDGKTDFLEVAGTNLTNDFIVIIRRSTCSASGDPQRIDYDGDGKSEFSVFRPSNGTWYRKVFSGGNLVSLQFGSNGDIPAPGDFDGDGKTDLAVFRPSTGSWYLLRSADQSFYAIQFGQSGDKPVPGDYDGDGRADIAVYRPSNGGWYMIRSNTNSFLGVAFGFNTDTPVPADFDGDLKTDIAVFRPSDGVWYLLASATNSFIAQPWGSNGDRTVAADYDGDGRSDIAIFRPSNGTWYILRSYNSALIAVQWGRAGDVPIPGFAGPYGLNPPVAANPVVWRPSTGLFYYYQSASDPVVLGSVGDMPVSAPYTVE